MATVVPTYTNGAGWSSPQLQPYVDATGFIPEGGPLTQDLAAGSHKITGLANGTNPADAAAFGQIPSVPVSSVFGRTGAVVATNGDYTAAQVGADASGAAAAAQAASQPLDSDLTAIAALSTTTYGRSLLTLASAAAARDTIGVRSRTGLSFVSNVFAETIDRCGVTTNGSVLATAKLYSVACPVLAGDVITNVSFESGATPFSGAANSWLALVDSSLNPIRQSTDQLTATLAANTPLTLAQDSVPVTAGARVASSTVTLTFPTLSQALSALFTAGDSITVSNANIAAYNGTFTIATVGASTITYVSGGSATDSLAAPFPTVRMAAGKRTYTVPSDGFVYLVCMFKGTVPTLIVAQSQQTQVGQTPVYAANGTAAGLSGTVPSPITQGTATNLIAWAAIS